MELTCTADEIFWKIPDNKLGSCGVSFGLVLMDVVHSSKLLQESSKEPLFGFTNEEIYWKIPENKLGFCTVFFCISLLDILHSSKLLPVSTNELWKLLDITLDSSSTFAGIFFLNVVHSAKLLLSNRSLLDTIFLGDSSDIEVFNDFIHS